jgi:hypothetical protein
MAMRFCLSTADRFDQVAAPGDGRAPVPVKNGLAAGAGGVTVSSAMKTLSAKAKIVELLNQYAKRESDYQSYAGTN